MEFISRQNKSNINSIYDQNKNDTDTVMELLKQKNG